MAQWGEDWGVVTGYGVGSSVRALRLVGEPWFWTVIDTK